MQRPLVTLDSNEEWLAKYRHLQGPLHDLRLVTDWNAPDVFVHAEPGHGPGWYEVVLVDHAPGERRHADVMWLRANHLARIFVLHDAEPGSDYIYQYTKIVPAFEHRRTYGRTEGGPHTIVLSDEPLP